MNRVEKEQSPVRKNLTTKLFIYSTPGCVVAQVTVSAG